MSLAAFLNHLLNFVLPGLAVGALTGILAKLVWLQELRACGVGRLMAHGAGAGVAALVLGMGLTGHDGAMLTYALVVAASAAAVYVAAWGWPPGRG